MNRLLVSLAAFALAGAAVAAPQPPAAGSYYYWLHPKLGMVKVDRATNAMIVSGKAARGTTVGGR